MSSVWRSSPYILDHSLTWIAVAIYPQKICGPLINCLILICWYTLSQSELINWLSDHLLASHCFTFIVTWNNNFFIYLPIIALSLIIIFNLIVKRYLISPLKSVKYSSLTSYLFLISSSLDEHSKILSSKLPNRISKSSTSKLVHLISEANKSQLSI